MRIKFKISNKDLPKTLIECSINSVCKKSRKLEVGSISLIIRQAGDKSLLHDLEGVGGYCPSAKFIQLSIDPLNKKFKKDPRGAISRSFAHELNHAARNFAGINIKTGTFSEHIISEGLADQFTYEIMGKLPVWNKRLPASKRKRLLNIIRKKADKKMTDKDYDEWFLCGSRRKGIPQWAGYFLGTYLVRQYLKSHPKESIYKITSMPSDKILNPRNVLK